MHCAKKSQCNKNGKKSSQPSFWRHHCWFCGLEEKNASYTWKGKKPGNTIPLTFCNPTAPRGVWEACSCQAPREDALPCEQPVSTEGDSMMWFAFHFLFFFFFSLPLSQMFQISSTLPNFKHLNEEMQAGVFNYTQTVFNSLCQCHLKQWCFPGKV